MTDSGHPTPRTEGEDYTERLTTLASARWKQVLDVQRPYRWNLRRLHLGRTLDVGCGIGRNLVNLGSNSVGVDHNPTSIAACRAQGLEAYTTEEFRSTDIGAPGAFDALLAAHLLEHVDEQVADDILAEYLPSVRPGGQVVLICPQEKGFDSDATHTRFCDLDTMRAHAERHGLTVERAYSFPFPRMAGKVFTYNEFVMVGRLPG